jgi:ABC-type antimicrobial peptide transport system permease subunit
VMGAAIGIALALLGTRLMSSLLFGVSATDPVSFALAAAAVLAIALMAAFLPAWWAARTDPLVALRHM